jgi:two-component system, sensor histidine kinase
MAGTISVNSQLGQGTVFTFNVMLGLTEKMPEIVTYAINDTLDQRLPKVLVVDDNVVNLVIMRKFLTKMGIEAEVVSNGREAIALVKDHHFDVIFMDIQMPEMDGLTATRCIRAMDLAVQPFIIALTANAFETDRERSLQAGMNEFLSKPFLFEEIKAKLAAFRQASTHHRAV